MNDKNCKNCGATEFKDGKCSYCGTDYGLTGDITIDQYLIAEKRKGIMEADGWEFSHSTDGSELIGKKDDSWMVICENPHQELVKGINKAWEHYLEAIYIPRLKDNIKV